MLTDAKIRSRKPASKPYKQYDQRGLFLKVSPMGAKLWRLRNKWGGVCVGVSSFWRYFGRSEMCRLDHKDHALCDALPVIRGDTRMSASITPDSWHDHRPGTAEIRSGRGGYW